MTNPTTRLRLNLDCGRQPVVIVARVTANGGAHGNPWTVELIEAQFRAFPSTGYVLATLGPAEKGELVAYLERHGVTWSEVEDRLIDRHVSAQEAA